MAVAAPETPALGLCVTRCVIVRGVSRPRQFAGYMHALDRQRRSISHFVSPSAEDDTRLTVFSPYGCSPNLYKQDSSDAQLTPSSSTQIPCGHARAKKQILTPPPPPRLHAAATAARPTWSVLPRSAQTLCAGQAGPPSPHQADLLSPSQAERSDRSRKRKSEHRDQTHKTDRKHKSDRQDERPRRDQRPDGAGDVGKYTSTVL